MHNIFNKVCTKKNLAAFPVHSPLGTCISVQRFNFYIFFIQYNIDSENNATSNFQLCTGTKTVCVLYIRPSPNMPKKEYILTLYIYMVLNAGSIILLFSISQNEFVI